MPTPLTLRIEAVRGKSVDNVLGGLRTDAAGAGSAADKAATETNKLTAEMGDAAKAAVTAGKAIDTAMGQADAAAKPLAKELANLRQDLKQVGTAGVKAMNDLRDATEDAAPAVDQLAGLLAAEQLSRGADGLRSVAGAAGEVFDGFAKAGEGVREVERDLKRVFADPKDVKRFTQVTRDLKDEYEGLFSGDQITDGLASLNKFGVATEENARRVAAMAAANKLSFDQVSETYGEFRKAAIGGKHDFGSTEELRSQLGIDPVELKAYGALTDSNNKLMGETAAQATAAQKALDAYIDAHPRYQNVAGRASDAASKFSTEILKFRSSVGESVNEFTAFVAKGLLPAAQGLNNLSGTTKAVIGILPGLASGAASATAGIVETGAFALLAANQLRGLAAGMTAAQLATATTVATFGGLAIASAGALLSIGLLTKSIIDYKAAAEQAKDADKALFATQEGAVNRPGRDRTGQSVDEIYKQAQAEEDLGKRRAVLTEGILAKQRQLHAAESLGSKERAKIHAEDLARLQTHRDVVDRSIKAEAEGAAQIEKAYTDLYANSLERFNEFTKRTSRGEFGTKKEALNELESIVPSLDGDTRKEADAQVKTLRKEALKEELDDLKAASALKKAERKVSLAEELADLEEQKVKAVALGRDGQDELVRIAREGAAARAADQAANDKRLQDAAKASLADAAKVAPATKGTDQAVAAVDEAIKRTKAWQVENAALIKQYPELGKAGQSAIDKLDLGKTAANTARLAKNFKDLQADLKALEDGAVTTQDKLDAVAKGRDLITKATKGNDITKDQAKELTAPLDAREKDTKLDDIRQKQTLLELDRQAAEQQAELAEVTADGSKRAADKVAAYKAQQHAFAIKQLELERDAALLAEEDKVAVRERFAKQMENLDRARTITVLQEQKKQVDGEREKLQQILDLNAPADDKKTKLSFTGLPTDQASFFSIGGSTAEDDEKRRATKRAKAELTKLDAQAAFAQANPDIAAKQAKLDSDRLLRAADPRDMIMNLSGETMPKGPASGAQTINKTSTNMVTINYAERKGRTVTATDPNEVVRIVAKEMDTQAIYNGSAGSLGVG